MRPRTRFARSRSFKAGGVIYFDKTLKSVSTAVFVSMLSIGLERPTTRVFVHNRQRRFHTKVHFVYSH